MLTGDKPIYLQIRDRIVGRILADGDGALLPSVRALAASAKVNPLTVAKAYQELQSAGLVVAKKGVGLFAAAGAADKLLASEREHFLQQEWPRVQARIDQLGLSARDLLALA
ncbi:GntR family transcriptional regulator [Polymorphobacter multimanifer]|uniref:GntR family transcriptional regulator n=1 Tax=Polymorphobacter multimanifer TaxID=1070431 RepID=A0A841L895_9SPHN|nr:GntR family transcriptional regulator [Polymorphobacter multimanifer]MBB6228660.1 GntR family transcriptional regulator [Polymorphobacter multimanifer]GGI91265.1 GntR family transcriptional regulator [Polymorphobacter multimanifer]